MRDSHGMPIWYELLTPDPHRAALERARARAGEQP